MLVDGNINMRFELVVRILQNKTRTIHAFLDNHYYDIVYPGEINHYEVELS